MLRYVEPPAPIAATRALLRQFPTSAWANICSQAQLTESPPLEWPPTTRLWRNLADAQASGACGRKPVEVRVLSAALFAPPPAMSSGPSLPTLPMAPPPAPTIDAVGDEREHLVRRARFLAWLGLGWHFVEAAIAIA